MAEGIDISLFEDDDGGGGAPGGGLSDTNKILEEIRVSLESARSEVAAVLQHPILSNTANAGGSAKTGGEKSEKPGEKFEEKKTGFMNSLQKFGEALGKGGKAIVVFNQAIELVQKAFGMLSGILSIFADTNATIAIAFERLQLFLRGILVILGDALAPVLEQVTDLFKEIIANIVIIFVDVIVALTPVLMLVLKTLKDIVSWFNGILGINPLDIEEQGLRRSATGVANVLAKFAGIAENPQGQPPVEVNIRGREEVDFEKLMADAIVIGRGLLGMGGEKSGFSLFFSMNPLTAPFFNLF